MNDWVVLVVILVALALALYGLWDVVTAYRDWLVKYQPRTKRGKRLALVIGALVVLVLLIGQCAEMLRIG